MTLIFDYPFFKLSPHDFLRIKTLVDGFVKEGKLTKEPSRELHWVGVSDHIILHRFKPKC